MLNRRRKDYLQARRDFARFVHTHQLTLKSQVEARERGLNISLTYGLWTAVTYDDGSSIPKKSTSLPLTLQIKAGKIPIGRRTSEGKTASEGDLTLVYSIGPMGHVAVFLYPFRSDLCEPFEKMIILDHFKMDIVKLNKRVESDIVSFISYGYETSMDAEASWRDSLRILWLRYTRPTNDKDGFVPSKSTNIISKIMVAGGSGTISGVMRLLTPFLTATAAAWLGITLSK